MIVKLIGISVRLIYGDPGIFVKLAGMSVKTIYKDPGMFVKLMEIPVKKNTGIQVYL